MPGFRTFFRTAPFLVSVVAVSVWLGRRAARRRALAAAVELPRIGPAPVEPEPIDIVTVVDDLLLAGR